MLYILSDACRSGSLQLSISVTERPYSAQTAAGVSDGPDLRIIQLHAGMRLKINAHFFFYNNTKLQQCNLIFLFLLNQRNFRK